MGKSIRIYLADGDVSGVRHAEIVNWTGQALAFSRNSLPDLNDWPEVRRQGVYFLLGTDEQTGQEVVYVGEAEVVAERVPQHVAGKDFWSECIAFTSKDENLTKSHIKYLESRLVSDARAAGRYLVKNTSTPQESGLPRPDKDAMDEFASNIRTLLGVLGHRVLDPIRSGLRIPTLMPLAAPTVRQEPSANLSARIEDFILRSGDIEAKAIRDPEGLVVLAGSLAARDIAASLSPGYRAIRERLVSTGVLADTGLKHLAFSKDHAFPSPSQAAAIVVGYMINGRQTWKSPRGQSLGDIEEAEAMALGNKLLGELGAVAKN